MHNTKYCASGFTLLELVVALVIFAAGLLAVQGLMVRQSRQVSHLEAWCRGDHTYYVVSQTDDMMRILGAPADLQGQVGQAAWTPTVADRTRYKVAPVSVIRSIDGRQTTAVVNLGS
jgi:prepilin-type N-terminal cleavage/methylation domain-containing protein